MILMLWTDQSSSEDDELSQGGKTDVGEHYYYFNETNEYFPSLHYNEDNVPIGSATPFCLHIEWIRKDMRKMYNLYKRVQNFPTCYNAKNPKFRWQKEDPKDGQDFYVWKQFA